MDSTQNLCGDEISAELGTQKVEAVLFDLDGTLVLSEPLHFQAAKGACELADISLEKAAYEQFFLGRRDRDGFEGFLAHMFEEIPPGLLNELLELRDRLFEELLEEAQPVDGAVEAVSLLADAGCALALVTGSREVEADRVLSNLEIAGHFSVVVHAESVKRGKPDPQGYLLGAKALEIAPSACLVVEDTPAGVDAAIRAGMRVVALTTTNPRERLHADVVIDSLYELGPVIESILSVREPESATGNVDRRPVLR